MTETIMEIKNLRKYFPIKMGLIKSILAKEVPLVRAVDGISFDIKIKELFGLVGESGCGKTTTGRCIIRLIEPTSGSLKFKGTDLMKLSDKEMQKMRSKIQIIFQDPYESLNPRMSIYDILEEPLRLQGMTQSVKETTERIAKTLEDMDLIPPEEFMYRFPHELSGGQRQRIAIARAFILNPEFIVADEPVSMLDASTRTEVVKLILHLPYTEALIAAVPVPDPTAKRTKIVIKGEVPSPINLPSGCRFHPRCPYAKEKCRREEPKIIPAGKDRYVACHFPLS